MKKVEEKESKVEKTPKDTTNESNNKKIEKIIDKLSDLTEDISEKFAPSPTIPGLGMITRALDKQELLRDRAEFDTLLMRLKCLDEKNKMIPYFEKKVQEWDDKKAGILEKIAKMLKNK